MTLEVGDVRVVVVPSATGAADRALRQTVASVLSTSTVSATTTTVCVCVVSNDVALVRLVRRTPVSLVSNCTAGRWATGRGCGGHQDLETLKALSVPFAQAGVWCVWQVASAVRRAGGELMVVSKSEELRSLGEMACSWPDLHACCNLARG